MDIYIYIINKIKDTYVHNSSEIVYVIYLSFGT